LLVTSTFVLAFEIRPARAFVSQEQVGTSITLAKTYYDLGEPVNVTLTITNVSNQTIDFQYSAKTFDFLVYNDSGFVYQWSSYRILPFIIMDRPLNPGESITEVKTWPQTTDVGFMSSGVQVSPGTYYIVGFPAGVFRTQPIEVNIAEGTGGTPNQALNLVNLKTVVGQGYDLPLNAAIENLKDSTEVLNITLFNNVTNTLIETDISISIGASTLSLNYNTASLEIGRYSTSVSGGNQSAEASVTLTIPGDVNGDFKVDLSDITLLAKAYNSSPGIARWNLNADINGDGTVGLSDLVIMARHYNQSIP
jgi:hypothetical protein